MSHHAQQFPNPVFNGLGSNSIVRHELPLSALTSIRINRFNLPHSNLTPIRPSIQQSIIMSVCPTSTHQFIRLPREQHLFIHPSASVYVSAQFDPIHTTMHAYPHKNLQTHPHTFAPKHTATHLRT